MTFVFFNGFCTCIFAQMRRVVLFSEYSANSVFESQIITLMKFFF